MQIPVMLNKISHKLRVAHKVYNQNGTIVLSKMTLKWFYKRVDKGQKLYHFYQYYRQNGLKSLANKAQLKISRKIRSYLISNYKPFENLDYNTFELPQKPITFSLVTVLYNKKKELPYFIKCLTQQTYPCVLEVIFVCDNSPAKEYKHIDKLFKKYISNDTQPKLSWKVIHNDENLGNCNSRNKGLREATGDIVVIVDVDCLLSENFLKAHAELHGTGSIDVVIGPMNLETNNMEPMKKFKYYSENMRLAFEDMQIQDRTCLNSFLNCVTRNFSVRREFAPNPLFDTDFSYSKNPNSGFGWEDTEMGYRLHKKGARIQFTHKCFSLHMTHPSSVPESEKPARSLKNFEKLYQKHPDFFLETRKWSQDTYKKIKEWSNLYSNNVTPEMMRLSHHFSQTNFEAKKAKPRKHYRILSYRWHVPHQYELYKTGHYFDLVTNIWPGFTNSWGHEQRPMPPNARFVDGKKIDFRNYDFALLHFDENALAYQNTNGILDQYWGAPFRWFRENCPLPQVAICHGTPQFYGQYNNPHVDASIVGKVIEESRLELIEYTKNILVICNSYQAHREWQFKNSKVIWQGFDPCEFNEIDNCSNGILSLGKAMHERPHYRGLAPYEKAISHVSNDHIPRPFKVKEPQSQIDLDRYAKLKYQNYIESVRGYSIYFNPTIRSPMPRSRGEAMMCGLTTVSLNNHDVDLFIKNGVNGFYSDDPNELGETLNFLIKNPSISKSIGKAGRRMASDVFNNDRYINEWQKTMESL